jgi:hypothetical protein
MRSTDGKLTVVYGSSLPLHFRGRSSLDALNSVPNKFGRVRLELNDYQYMVKKIEATDVTGNAVSLCPATVNIH